MCAEFETEVIIINKSKESVTCEQELVPDMIELITVFSAGFDGRAQSEKSETD
jgi:predicted site-specific integrase-resolvase